MSEPGVWAPDRYRDLLCVLARRLQLDPRLDRRFDSSDLVQEALLKAHQSLVDFRGRTEGERVKWLHEILVNVARDKFREARAAKRNLQLENSLEAMLADSSARLEAFVAAESSPSQQAERRELLLTLGEALSRLPADQRDAIILHHLLGASVSVISQQLDCSKKAVAGLLYRGLKKLRENMELP